MHSLEKLKSQTVFLKALESLVGPCNQFESLKGRQELSAAIQLIEDQQQGCVVEIGHQQGINLLKQRQ